MCILIYGELMTMDKKIKIWQVNWIELYRISFTNVVIFNNKSFYLFNFNCCNFSSTTYRSNHRRCSLKKSVRRISQNSEKNTCARVSFLIKLQAEHLFWKNNSCGFFWIYFLQRLHVKFWNSISFNCFKIENYFTLCGTFCP